MAAFTDSSSDTFTAKALADGPRAAVALASCSFKSSHLATRSDDFFGGGATQAGPSGNDGNFVLKLHKTHLSLWNGKLPRPGHGGQGGQCTLSVPRGEPISPSLLDLSVRNTLRLAVPPEACRTLRSRSGRFPHGQGRAPGQHYRTREGSNVLLPPRLTGTVWHLAAFPPRFERHGRVEVFGGLALDALVCAASREGLWGLENLSAIPGTVGAAPVQNVGAYGQSLDEVVEALEVFDLRTGQCAWWVAKDCDFSYRNSRFRRSLGAYLVLTMRLRLHRGGQPVLAYAGVEARLAKILSPGAQARPSDLAQAVRALRAEKLPDWHRLPNVGSFLKTPSYLKRLFSGCAPAPELALRPFASSGGKVSAAALIQRAGWRGRRRGPVGMAQEHALVLVNYGGCVSRGCGLVGGVRAGERLCGLRGTPGTGAVAHVGRERRAPDGARRFPAYSGAARCCRGSLAARALGSLRGARWAWGPL